MILFAGLEFDQQTPPKVNGGKLEQHRDRTLTRDGVIVLRNRKCV